MNDIVMKLEEKNSGNIMPENRWIRNCPECNRVQVYSDKYKLERAIINNISCKSCSHQGQFVTEKTKQKISEANKGKKKSDDFRKKCSIRMKNLSPEMRQKLNEPLERYWGHRKGSVTSDDVKRKLRLAMINYIQMKKLNGGQMKPNYNHNACEYFDKLNNETGWRLIHAQNGGEFYIKELGYWVDAYDEDRNIVVEYDELYHKNKSQEKKDLLRSNEIKNHLHCKFLRYKEQTKELIEY